MTPHEHEHTTAILPGDASDSPADTLSAPSSLSAIRTGLEAAERARARTIGLVFFFVAGLTAVWAPFLDGHPALKLPVLVILGTFSLFGLYVSWAASRPKRYTRKVFWAYGVSAVMTSSIILVYLGPFSPTALAVTLGIGFFGQGADKIGAWVICSAAIGACLMIYALIVAGVVPDVGVFRGDEGGLSGGVFMTAMVPLVLFVTLMQARWSRDAVEGALQTAVASTMEASRRGVQLEEAQAELDRIAAAGGVLGPMSGHSVGSYKLGPLLGRGGSGEVYDAIDTRSSTQVAVKVLRSSEAEHADVITRFQREGEIATRLVSRYVARVHHYGQDPGGTLFIAMERLDGSDLASILRKESRLPPDEAQELVHDVCRGISEAHTLGIIHRDIKPHNIFRAQEPEGTEVWKVLDFGVSKLAASFVTITHGMVVGTPQYMSPEQARGEPVDLRTDVYGIGAVLYRVLTGRPPMPSKGATALFHAAYRRPDRPSLVAPDLSQEIEAILALALAPQPADRFQTVEILRTAFDQALSGQLPRALLRSARKIPWNHTESYWDHPA